jgi:hypothetical protein
MSPQVPEATLQKILVAARGSKALSPDKKRLLTETLKPHLVPAHDACAIGTTFSAVRAGKMFQ